MSEIVGRSTELGVIDSLLAEPDGDSAGLLLRGDPGVGKTALLNAAAARAEAAGMRVLRVSGAEFEAGTPFSAVHQMLYPLREQADRRDTVHRLLDLAAGPPPDRVAASTAVLAFLGESATERPLSIIVDDVPWIDPASAAVLAFVARRVAGVPVLFFAATRPGAYGLVRLLRLPEREIRPLPRKDSAKLLDSRWPGLAPGVRRRLLGDADGNPLALRELPNVLTDRQRHGLDPLPGLLPLSGPRACTVCPNRPGGCCCWPRWNPTPTRRRYGRLRAPPRSTT